MSCLKIKDFAGLVVDALKFAADGACVEGRLAFSDMPRLADVLLDFSGYFDCRLSGLQVSGEQVSGELVRHALIKCVLHLTIDGTVQLRCQRCLSGVPYRCVVDSRLLLVPPGQAWPEDEDASDEYDAIPADHEMSVLALIEEEVLLALPIVPRHESCRTPLASGDGVEEAGRSPFAVLAGLKKH